MVTIDNLQSIWNILSNQDLWGKIILIILLVLYIMFAVVVARQIQIMNDIVKQINFSPTFQTLAVIHIIFSVALILFVVLLI